MIIGYARVSTEEQHLDAQISALEATSAERIFSEKVSAERRTEVVRMRDKEGRGIAELARLFDVSENTIRRA